MNEERRIPTFFVVAFVLQLVLNLFFAALLWLHADGANGQIRSILWELNRHTLILIREGIARPEDQLGLPVPLERSNGRTPEEEAEGLPGDRTDQEP